MKVALVDNGSLEPAAHQGLRRAAAAIAERSEVAVEAVSWKHSDRLAAALLEGEPAWTLAPWIREQIAAGEHEFVFIPFFISPQGAIGSSLRRDLEVLRQKCGGFDYSFSSGLTEVLPRIAAARIRETVVAQRIRKPAVIVVDHGGPSPTSAAIRNQAAARVRELLNEEVGPLEAASMETPGGPGFEFNRPLLAEILAREGYNSGEVLIAPLFLSPGRHAGAGGDLQRIARAAQKNAPRLRCHFADLIGSHPLASETLADGLIRTLRVGLPS